VALASPVISALDDSINDCLLNLVIQSILIRDEVNYVVLTSSDEKLTYLDEVSTKYPGFWLPDIICRDELLPQLTDENESPIEDRFSTHWLLERLPEPPIRCSVA